MIEEELFRLEREAELRVREAGDREIDKGGPGSGRRASEAMNAPMLEVAAIRKMRQRFGDTRLEIDRHKGNLRGTKQDSGLPSDVKRHRERQAEVKLAGLEQNYKALEAEAAARYPVGKDPEQLERRAREAEGLSDRELHRLKRDIATSPALALARKAQLDTLAHDTNAGRLSPRDTPRAEDAAEARRRAGRNLLLRPRTGGPKPDAAPAGGDSLPPARGDAPTKTDVAAASSVALPGGGTFHPSVTGQEPAADLGDAAKFVVRAAPRAIAAAGAGLAVLLTPRNSQAEYHYFGEDGDERLRVAPGDLRGVVERRDPRTGVWRQSGQVGEIATVAGEQGEWVVTGTRDQVARATGKTMSQPDDPLPRAPGLIPPVVPGMDEPVSFPMEERGPTIYVTPAEASGPDIKIFPIPENAKPHILIFPDMSGVFDSYNIQESRRGNDDTRDHLDQVRNWFLDRNPGWRHIGGGRKRKTGEPRLEYHIPGPGSVFVDEKGRGGDRRPGGKWADLTFKGPKGKIIHIQTVDFDKNGKPTDRELGNAEVIRRATGATVILIPKPARKR